MNIVSIYKKPVKVIFNPHHLSKKKNVNKVHTMFDVIISSENDYLKIKSYLTYNIVMLQREVIYILKYFIYLTHEYAACRKLEIYDGDSKMDFDFNINSLKNVEVEVANGEMFLLIPIEK